MVRTWAYAYPEGYGDALEGLRSNQTGADSLWLQRDRAAADKLGGSCSGPGKRPGSLGQGRERRLNFGVLKVEMIGLCTDGQW